MILSVQNACCGYGTRKIISGLSFGVDQGEVICLLGPNGVGKTTLFKTLLGFINLIEGHIYVGGDDIRKMSPRARARLFGYVPQVHDPPFPYKVSDVILMGRTAHLGIFASPGREDRRIAQATIELLGISHLKERIYTELSGGERQLVLIARALTQQPRIMIMDEPTSNLDFGNQVRVLQQINALSRQGLAVVMTSHIPNHAFLCSTRVALIKRDNVYCMGNADEVITEQNLREAYGIDVKIASISNGNGEKVKACIPLLHE